jgi:hypothetical protein
MKLALPGALALACLSLAGCNSALVQTDIAAALNYGCPVVAAVQAQNPKLSNAQLAAEKSLALACPPNPPPTSIAVAASDLVGAASLLLPLLPKAQADELRVRIRRIELDVSRTPLIR